MATKRHPDKIRHYPLSMRVFIKSISNRIDGGKNALIGVFGPTGCLAGDTIINTSRNELGRPFSIKYLYNVLNGKNEIKVKKWDLSRPTFVRSFNGEMIKLNKIKKVLASGIKKVYLLKLENSLCIKATEDHKFLTRDNGWIELGNLNNDYIMCDTLNAKASNRKRIKLRDIGLNVGRNHPYNIQPNGQMSVHTLIYEARMNNLEFTEYLDILLNEPDRCKKLKYINPSIHQVHHKDGCHYNNSVDNLELLTKNEHRLKHTDYTNFSQGIPKFSKVLSVKYVGEEDTYDIECEDPHHNFVANGMVVHNSGKSLMCLQLMRGLYLYRNGEEPKEDYIVGHTFFKASDFMKEMRVISDKLVEEKKQPNTDFWLWDEAGVEAGNRSWQSARNRVIGYLAQTFRNLKQVIFFTTPSIGFIDPHVRKLLHYYLEAINIDKKNKLCVVKPLALQYNIRQDKLYYHNLQGVVVDKKGDKQMMTIEFMAVPKISNDLENLYELKKNEFTKELNSDIQRLLDKFEVNKEKEKKGDVLELYGQSKKVADCLMSGIVNNIDISRKTGIAPSQVSKVFHTLERKGFDVNYYRNKDRPSLVLNVRQISPSPQFKLQSDSNQNQNNNPFKVVKNEL